MAKKKKSYRKKNKAIPVAIVAPMIMPALTYVAPKVMAGDFKGAVASMAQEYTGLNPDGRTFNPKQILEWGIPTVAGVIVHKGANKFGVNKHIRRVSMGFIEL